MRYGQIREFDVANGPGIRVSIFVTGCSHNCYNCFNKEYQDFNYGKVWTDETTEVLLSYLKKDQIKGLSVLGGEPMENAKELSPIIDIVRKNIDKSIWLWSGYTFEEIIKDEDMKNLLEKVDILVDGKFIERLKNLKLKFRGSSNQRIIDVKKSLYLDKVVEYKI